MLSNWFLEISKITTHPIAVPLVTPFETSFGVQHLRACVLVRVQTRSGVVGWGEVTANWDAGYSYETVHTALHILNDLLIPRLMRAVREAPLRFDERWEWLESVRGHPLAKHGLISALLTGLAAEQNMPLAGLIQHMAGASSRRDKVEVGVSIGVQTGMDATLETIQRHLDEGYRRIKLKIKPRWDVEMLREVRHAFPHAVIMADANSAYSLNDVPMLKQLDEFGLLMIEQPLGHDDIYEHSKLQPQLATSICLDESLHTLGHVQLAHELGACRIVNLKPQRVGGLFESIKIHNYCQHNGIGLWIGGMLETGVGRAISLALATLPGITLPCDLSATARYYNPDIADPPFVLNAEDSTLNVPTAPGLGVTINMERLMAASAAFQQELNR